MSCFWFSKRDLTPQEKKAQAFANAEKKRLAALAKEEMIKKQIHKDIGNNVLKAYRKGEYAYYYYNYKLNYLSKSWITSVIQEALDKYGIICEAICIEEYKSSGNLPNIYFRFEKQSMSSVLSPPAPPTELVRSEATFERWTYLSSKKQKLEKQKQKSDCQLQKNIFSKLQRMEKMYLEGQHHFMVEISAFDFYDSQIISQVWMSYMNKHEVFKDMTVSCSCNEHLWCSFWLSVSIEPA